MQNNSSQGCSPTGCGITVVVIGLLIGFFGNKKLGQTLLDIGIWIIIGPILIAIIVLILMKVFDKKD